MMDDQEKSSEEEVVDDCSIPPEIDQFEEDQDFQEEYLEPSFEKSCPASQSDQIDLNCTIIKQAVQSEATAQRESI